MSDARDATPRLERAADTRLLHMLLGYRHTQVINVAAHLGLADLLDDERVSSAEMARATGSDLDSLRRLLRALTAMGVVTEVEPDLFTLSALGLPLRQNAPDSIRNLAMLFAEEGNWRAWGDMLYSVRTGKGALEHLLGVRPFEYLHADQGRSQVFNEAMAEYTRITVAGIVAAYDFSGVRTVVDVGGNDGTLIAAVLASNAGLRGVLFDTPAGVKGAQSILDAAGVSDRCEIVEGDFFQAVPAGGDVYLLKSIVHDWDPQHAPEILRSCRRVMPESGVLLLIESVLPATIGAPPEMLGTVLMDLNMLVTTGGRERTETEFSALLEKAGFRMHRLIEPIPRNSYHIIEATRV